MWGEDMRLKVELDSEVVPLNGNAGQNVKLQLTSAQAPVKRCQLLLPMDFLSSETRRPPHDPHRQPLPVVICLIESWSADHNLLTVINFVVETWQIVQSLKIKMREVTTTET
jgi:hypothetical protein